MLELTTSAGASTTLLPARTVAQPPQVLQLPIRGGTTKQPQSRRKGYRRAIVAVLGSGPLAVAGRENR